MAKQRQIFKTRLIDGIENVMSRADGITSDLLARQRSNRPAKPEQPPTFHALNRQHLTESIKPLLANRMTGRVGQLLPTLAQYVPETIITQLSEQAFKLANDLAHYLSSASQVMDLAQVRSIHELALLDSEQCDALAQKILEKNNPVAWLEGGATGLVGMIGSVVDWPLMLLIAMRMIHQIGYCYGVDLRQSPDQGREVVLQILQNSDLDLLLDKQALILSLTGMHDLVFHHDVVGAALKGTRIQEAGMVDRLRLAIDQVRRLLPKRLVSGALPLVKGSAGIVYNRKLLDSILHSAQQAFQPQHAQNLPHIRANHLAHALHYKTGN